MRIQYKKNIQAMLKDAGYNTTRIRREKVIAESVMQMIRTGRLVTWDKLALICDLLDCQPGDILEFTRDDGVTQ